MPDVTIKADPDVLDQFAGMTGLLPLTPQQNDPSLSPMQPAGNDPTAAGNMPLPPIGGAPLSPLMHPADNSPTAAPGTVDYAQQKLAADTNRPQPGLLGKIGGWAASILTPHVAAMIPQTPLGRIAELNQDRGQLSAAQQEQRAEQTAQQEGQLRGAQTEEATARAGAETGRTALEAAQSAAAGKGEWKSVPDTNFEINTLTGETREMKGVKVLPNRNTPEAQLPLSSEQVDQANKQMQSRYQALNKGKSLPPEFKLGPGATVADYNRASESLKSLESTAGTAAQRQFNEGLATQNLDLRKSEQQQKLTKPYQDTLDEIDEAKEFAASPSATNDYGLLMDFIGITKPESIGKMRLNAQELKLATGTRSSFGDLEALGQKIANGQMLTADQRKKMLDTMEVIGKRVQSRLAEVSGSGGSSGAKSGASEAPEGTRVQMPDGSFKVKKGGKWQAD